MINKIYKRIHNKYSGLFKFFFFLRYLFIIFLISLALLLIIPNFLDYEKRGQIITSHLYNYYGVNLKDYKNIKFNSFPIPNLEIQNARIELKQNPFKIDVLKLNIYPKFASIYNFKNFKTNKIIFNKNKILLEDSDLKILGNYIYNLKNRFSFKDLEIEIIRKNQSILNIKKINFSNHGNKKNKMYGELFDKKFKIIFNDDYKKINFKLLNTGIKVSIDLDEINKNFLSGIVKSKVLKSKLKFNFNYSNKKITIYNSYFRNKHLTFKNKSVINYNPFFDISSVISIEEINSKLLKELNINNILRYKTLIKKINSKNEINFKSKKFDGKLIDDLNLVINMSYGRLNYSKKFLISDNLFQCQGNVNLLEENPILSFKCNILSKDKKKLLKNFLIKYKKKNEILKLEVNGNLSILGKKINFKNITMNDNYKASREDLAYFKDTFEIILFDKDFLSIFNFDKIKKFILEIS